MTKFIKIYMVSFCIIVFFPWSQAAAMPEIMGTDQIQAGMHGIAKTVIEGTTIDTFDIEITGVIDAGKDSDGRIIAIASGPVIDKTGGVLQGMSGSPVYIDDKLIGAVSGGWKEINNRTCIITPIHDMMKIWDMPDLKNKTMIQQVNLKQPPTVLSADNKTDIKTASKNTVTTTQAAVAAEKSKPLMTPLMVSGFTDAGLNLLKEKMAPYNLVPYAVGSYEGKGETVTLEPGSSVGVEVVRGDLSVAAIGTVTALDNGRVLAFGHPFLRKGNVNYFMTDAHIITTASGDNTGFKVGAPGNLVGRINQDRSAGVAGIIGRYPSVIPIQINVDDLQLNRHQTYAVQLAYDEELASSLAASVVYNAIDQTIDRAGTGTAKIEFEILTNAVDSGVIKRSNMYYSPQDVGQLSITEIYQALNLLCTNTMGETDIVGIKVNIKVDANRRTASIIEAVPEKQKVKQGETVNVKLQIKPYRKPAETLIVPYKIAKNQPAGMTTLEIRGGGLVPVAQLLMQQQGLDLSPEEDKMQPLSEKLDAFMKANKNNEIIISPAAPMLNEVQQAAAIEAAIKQSAQLDQIKPNDQVNIENKKTKLDKPEADLPAKFDTNYIIDNIIKTSIQVIGKKN
ncbi:SpoIVB peptidase S55 [Propionispira arboris]|uniref:SpoIVB peptidase S55 n=1 Tax=Propionispira arboris TaxID=84035 RepID=A0A1H6U2I7_9FIRM|nr:SpoIVB peptidase S55 domain-containing protein [Propionispira arboris]SEI82172.1 SpoIVB peptidase S55 [Propionispira arboris]